MFDLLNSYLMGLILALSECLRFILFMLVFSELSLSQFSGWDY